MSVPGIVGKVGIFWDYENLAIPANVSGYSLVKAIFEIARRFGSVTSFKCYANFSEKPSINTRNSELHSSGVSLIDCPHNGRKNVVDEMVIVDMMAFAIDNPAPTTVVLIAGDKDYAYALSTLRSRLHYTVLISKRSAHISLTAQPSTMVDWELDLINPLKNGSRPEQNVLGLQANTERVVSFDSNRSKRRKSSMGATTDGEDKVSPKGPSSSPTQSQPGPTHALPGSPIASPPNMSPSVSPYLHPHSAAISGPDDSELDEPPQHSSSRAAPPTGHSRQRSTKLPAAFGPHNRSISSPVFSSTRQTSRRQPLDDPSVPKQFQGLMAILRKYQQEGEDRPLRSSVSHELKSQDPQVYQKVVINEFQDYIQLAISKQLVVVGGEGAKSWISIRPLAR